jgi:hypothetical protein
VRLKLFFQLRKYEIELRNRDQSQNVALQNALSVMQEKNSTLEKNLSAETRVKLDLFSALGEARRQLEIKDSKFFPAAISYNFLQQQI